MRTHQTSDLNVIVASDRDVVHVLWDPSEVAVGVDLLTVQEHVVRLVEVIISAIVLVSRAAFSHDALGDDGDFFGERVLDHVEVLSQTANFTQFWLPEGEFTSCEWYSEMLEVSGLADTLPAFMGIWEVAPWEIKVEVGVVNCLREHEADGSSNKCDTSESKEGLLLGCAIKRSLIVR